MAALRYILLAAAITLTLTLLAHLVLPARGPIPRRTGRVRAKPDAPAA